MYLCKILQMSDKSEDKKQEITDVPLKYLSEQIHRMRVYSRLILL